LFSILIGDWGLGIGGLGVGGWGLGGGAQTPNTNHTPPTTQNIL